MHYSSKKVRRTLRKLNPLFAVGMVSALAFLGTIALPSAASAAIGTISISSIEPIGAATFRIQGFWQPQAYPCWTPGDGGHFHYYIRIEDNGVPVSPNPMVNPAACNEDYRSPVAGANVLLGGHWPAIAHPNNGNQPQPEAVFTLGPGAHVICAILVRVNDDGLIIGSLRECYSQKVMIEPTTTNVIQGLQWNDGSNAEQSVDWSPDPVMGTFDRSLFFRAMRSSPLFTI